MTLRIRKTYCSNLALACSLALAAISWAPGAMALDFPSISLSGNYYGGAGLGGSQINPVVTGSGFSVTDSNGGGTQLFIGRDLTARFSVEGYYSDLGSAAVSSEDATDGRIDYSTAGLSGLFYLLGGGGVDSLANRSGLNIYARLGAGRINNEGLGIQFDRDNAWQVSGGFGAEYNLRNGFGVRTELHNFDADARVVSFNIVKRFRVQKNSGSKLPVILDKADVALKISDKDAAAAKNSAALNKDSDGDGVNDRDDLCNSTRDHASVDDNGCNFTGVIEGVTFSSGSADLTKQSSTALDKFITQLEENEEVRVSVQAHTDNRGTAANNMNLSRKRAETVVRYLVDTGAVDLDRVAAIGFGESKPRLSNKTAAGRLANRRVEIKIAK